MATQEIIMALAKTKLSTQLFISVFRTALNK